MCNVHFQEVSIPVPPTERHGNLRGEGVCKAKELRELISFGKAED
jgi:hypothetical protein